MKKTYHGSCHCGRVKYEADIDLTPGHGQVQLLDLLEDRWWGTLIKPADFRLLSGEDALSDYQWGHFIGHNMFCKYCGVRCYNHGHLEVARRRLRLDQSGRAGRPRSGRASRGAGALFRRPRQQLDEPPAETRHL